MDKIAISDKGYKRDNNQDYHFMDPLNRYFIIADGMGGHKGGEVASYTAVSAAHELLNDYSAEGITQLQDKLAEAFNAANQAVYQKSLSTDSLSGMGTTMIVSYFYGNRLVIAHAGDSRAYLFRCGELLRLTKDHSLVQEMVENGQLDSTQAQKHPKRNIITKAVGTQDSIKPDISLIELNPEGLTYLIMCTDGLTDYVTDKEIENICRKFGSLEDSANEMLSLALKRGGFDNISIVAVRLNESSGSCL
ncbi:MAG: serine/threonine-protein phosphatase [Clostridiales bacterium]|nr:MAG: serine/threonine-protein phosphatase [Clostridiales bacterium]